MVVQRGLLTIDICLYPRLNGPLFECPPRRYDRRGSKATQSPVFSGLGRIKFLLKYIAISTELQYRVALWKMYGSSF